MENFTASTVPGLDLVRLPIESYYTISAFRITDQIDIQRCFPIHTFMPQPTDRP